jgi:glutathione S-transferase
MLRVHHLNSSRSQRILWLLEEVGTPYEVIFYRRDPKTWRAPAALREVHPLGKSPVLEDDGRVFAESGVIVEYLVARYGAQFAPSPGDDDYWRYRYWMHYAEGSLMSQLLLKLVADKLGVLAWPIRKMVREQLSLHLDFLESEAAKSRWIAGDQLSAADVMMSYPLEAAAARAGLDASRPHLWRLLHQIRERPAYIRALSRADQASASV